ncbi:lamb YcsF family protein [Panaeolus papilionaceus]|nr:lamb YcsF family protein [Panaeolus papilionaceus]
MLSTSAKPLRATVNCDMGEGFSLYVLGDDEALMQHIHLANVACGFHASDFNVMNKTVGLAKQHSVLVGAHPSLPDLQGFGRREMAIEPEELKNCFIYQVGALCGFLNVHDLKLNHIKPHGAIYGQSSRSLPLSKAIVEVVQLFCKKEGNKDIALIGLAGTAHQQAAEEAGVRFIPEWFADLEYSPEGKLLITKKHDPIPLPTVRERVMRLLNERQVTTVAGTYLPLGTNVNEVSICCHSDTPDAVPIAKLVKQLVDDSNNKLPIN